MKPQDHHLKQVKFLSDNILYIVIAVLIGAVIYMHQGQESEEIDSKILEYENTIAKMKQDADKESKRVDSLVAERDSTLAELANKEIVDKEVIHEKFDKKRSDILILSDDESVELLSKNLGGI